MSREIPSVSERIEYIRSALSFSGEITSQEIYTMLASIGLSNRHAELAIQRAFQFGVLRRKKAEKGCGYYYRLADKYPKWGEAHTPRPEEKPGRKHVALYKKTSKIFRFDQLLLSARGQSMGATQ